MVNVLQGIFGVFAFLMLLSVHAGEMADLAEYEIEPGAEIVSMWPGNTKVFFVGNSLIEGIRQNDDNKHLFWCETGISLPSLNKRLTPPNEYDIAVIEMGSNELGAYGQESFESEYASLIEKLGCPCYCLSIPPVNQIKSRYAARVCNENVELYNQYIQNVCEKTGAMYLDCTPFFGKELNPDWTGDGLHLRSQVYVDWYSWILQGIGIKSSS